MRIAALMCAICLCAPPALRADPPAARADAKEPARARPGLVTPVREAGKPARSNADRLHSLLRARPRALVAKPPSQPAVSKRAAASALAAPARGLGGGSSVMPPKESVSTRALRTPASLKAVILPRASAVGGAHATGPPRLGGPANGGAAPGRARVSAGIDGTRVRRKY